MRYVYDGKFSGNILIVGRTGCGKTAFVQKLAINRFFGELNAAEWVSFIKLDKAREAEIQSCFECELDFYYPRNKEQFEELLEYFKTKSNSSEIENNMNNDNINGINDVNITNYGEKSIQSRLIVMDDVSGLADLFTKFANFLTVARNLVIIVCIFFMLFIRKKQYGGQFISDKLVKYFSCICTVKYLEKSFTDKLYT